MKHVIYIAAMLILISCDSNSGKNENTKNRENKDRICNVLDLSDSMLNKLTVKEVRRSDISKRIKLSNEQVMMLPDLNTTGCYEEVYLYGVNRIYENVFVSFILVVGVSGERFYMITTDCSTKELDHISLTECDYFDVLEQGEDSETGLFISKYFRMLNDTSVSVRSITKEETKSLSDGKILKSQKDSITINYYLNRKGKIELLQKDSVRIKSD